ncbi:hypothetical protein [Allobranchiibius huperziae]|uniref:Putative membrane protein YdbT with pleckstrin-like domain n=1 Tax=Allobranchiibius huperziae TaxID=1874116 RepID=A0A853DI23_9MICO|nr:hypothetical protein [Allobranchiibius huperziae]NYJ76408.1 putative membrane protein YdbT with pleckstrin-like domain [Allobranchiibius huperziae]
MPVTQLRIRWSVAIASSAPVAVIGAAFCVLAIPPFGLGLGAAIVFVLLAGSMSVRRVRRRTLTVHPDVLVVQRDQYRLSVPWSRVTAVQSRRHQVVMRVEELVCAGAAVDAVSSSGRPSVLPKRLEGHPALSRVMVSLYSKDWKNGPIGEKVRAAGVHV